METASSSLSSTKTSETASSPVPCARSSGIESSSVLSTKTSENTTKAAETASEGSIAFSPIRLPDRNKAEALSKTLVPESDKSSQVGAMRSDNQTSRKERKVQSHPYTRRPRRDSWSFDIPYRNLQDLMRDLTTATFREKNGDVPKSQKSRGRAPCRFRNYKFRRSSVPDCLPDSPDDSDEFTAEAIPDFEERKRKADIIETMQTSKKEDQEDYTAEQSSYSPGATQASKVKPGGDKEKEAEGDKANIHTRLLRISKLTSPAQVKEKSPEDKDTASKGSSKDSYQESNKDTALSGNGISSSNTNRKRRISQACSPNRRRDWRQSRSRHNTGLGETRHSEQLQEEMFSQCRSKNTPTDVKSGKSSQRSSRESTPSDLTTGTALRRQGSREYSPSECYCVTGEGKSSRENTPTDGSETLKKKILIKRLDSSSEKESSLSPATVRSDDCINPNMFRPITAHKLTADSAEKEGGDLRNYIQQLKGKKEKKSEPFTVKVNVSDESGCSEKLASDKDNKGDNNGPTAPPESNRAGSPNKRISG
ncbi:hypothetical protein KP79_PYT11794 [Mizuhopecten yessoensis]|uniref:Uncharacterized protein n=1 Tax=Mizuhopecten yessoensis TaxID=6573 RepID=A0A210PSB2_MIZYE|nr:hypothetical protein KP79_PYT11794 [Mizuhopecten yessoensis]